MDETNIPAQEVSEGKFFAIISYISFLCVVALLLKRNNRFAVFHAKQGLVLFVFEVVAFVISIIPILGLIIRTLGFVIFIIFSLWGIYQALMGYQKPIPILSAVADKISL